MAAVFRVVHLVLVDASVRKSTVVSGSGRFSETVGVFVHAASGCQFRPEFHMAEKCTKFGKEQGAEAPVNKGFQHFCRLKMPSTLCSRDVMTAALRGVV